MAAPLDRNRDDGDQAQVVIDGPGDTSGNFLCDPQAVAFELTRSLLIGIPIEVKRSRPRSKKPGPHRQLDL
ncbi:hypothetical protein, partial [Mesorhizobium sp.]|uniref:hypothetical protein n=1 Tax=Mesorhizobium sp. TaxID=1871066 RepID=UPI0025F8141A